MIEMQQMMEQFAKDYDLSSMNYNDKLALEILCGLYIQVQDNVQKIEESKEKEKWNEVSELVDVNKKLITNIEQLEKQLGISRKARGKDKETSVIIYVEDLRKRAKNFLEKKLHYIYCPKCSMLLATMWFLYLQENNQLNLTCGRCKEHFIISTDEDFIEKTTKVIQERRNNGEIVDE